MEKIIIELLKEIIGFLNFKAPLIKRSVEIFLHFENKVNLDTVKEILNFVNIKKEL